MSNECEEIFSIFREKKNRRSISISSFPHPLSDKLSGRPLILWIDVKTGRDPFHSKQKKNFFNAL